MVLAYVFLGRGRPKPTAGFPDSIPDEGRSRGTAGLRWKGFTPEATIAVRDHAFHVLRLPRLTSLVRVGNMASRRVAEKVGMHCAAETTRHGVRYWQFTMAATRRVSTRVTRIRWPRLG